jgi:hypothetical protein
MDCHSTRWLGHHRHRSALGLATHSMTARAFTNPNLGHEVRIEQNGREVRLVFITHTEAKASALAEDLLAQLKGGGVNLTLMGKPTSITDRK